MNVRTSINKEYSERIQEHHLFKFVLVDDDMISIHIRNWRSKALNRNEWSRVLKEAEVHSVKWPTELNRLN